VPRQDDKQRFWAGNYSSWLMAVLVKSAMHHVQTM
jgi:hypothetical protein